MHQRLQIDNLRGMDATTLELMVGDSLRRPMAQMVPPTMADLIALAEVEKPPSALRTALRLFREKVPREVADIPDGTEFANFVRDLKELSAVRVPETLRAAVRSEAARGERTQASRELAEGLLESWADTPPEAFVVAEGAPAIAQPATASKSRSGASGTRSSKRKAAPKRIKVEKLVDPERVDFIVQTCIGRLQAHMERGLAENVLVVGITHKVRAKYSDIAGKEVLDALKGLEARDVVRKKAGRWVLERRW